MHRRIQVVMVVLSVALALLAGTTAGTAAPDAPYATKPSLKLTIKGLPSGTPAAVKVTGPQRYKRTVTASTVLRKLNRGSYTVTAADVRVGSNTWAPKVRKKTLNVRTGTTSYTVTYVRKTPPVIVTGPEIVNNNRPQGTLGVPYTDALEATGTDITSATWSWATTGRPPGLALAPDGTVSGTPTETGTYYLDATVSVGGRSDTEGISITVNPPPPPTEPDTWKSVDAGIATVCGIKTDDTAWCWGWAGGSYRALGNGSTVDASYPVAVAGGHTWKSLDVGGFSCGIRSDDTAWCWGVNNYGELGNGSTTSPSAPTQVSGGGTWTSLATGYAKACGVKTDGTAWCWGAGQLGNGVEEQSGLVPVQVQGGAVWTAATVQSPSAQAGGDAVCLTRTGGTVWCFGPNFYGELGNDGGTQDVATVPGQIATDETFAVVDGGGRHACAIATDADLWCWGHNFFGQVGDGSGNSRVSVPVEVDTASWRSVDGGHQTTCGVRTDDTGWCWGANDYLQLGPASDESQELTPTQVPGTWSSIDAGDFATCGVATSGYAYCWGTVFSGGLGNGSSTTSATPVLVLG